MKNKMIGKGKFLGFVSTKKNSHFHNNKAGLESPVGYIAQFLKVEK